VTSLLAWIAFPLVAHLACTGLGSLGERLARAELPRGLLAPLGACLGVVVTLPVFELGGGAVLAAPWLALLAIAGLVLARRELRARLLAGWPLLAGLGAYALFLGPVVLTGHWTWLGYNFVNDTSVNMVLTDHIAHHGVELATGPPSSATGIVNGTIATSYPLGIHALLASLNWLVPVRLEAVYQPFIAYLAAGGAMALTVLARRLGLTGGLAAALGLVAVGANITFQYSLHGAFKEVGIVLVLCTCAALCRVALDARLHPGTVALLGACLAAGLAIVATAAAPYAGMFALVLLAACLLEPARPRLARVGLAAAAGIGTLVVLALPAADDTLAFGKIAANQYSGDGGLTGANSPSFLGHLLRALPIYQSLGTWLRGDYRYPVEPGAARYLTALLLALAGALVLVAAVAEIRRRRVGALLALVPALAVYIVALPRLSPYAEAKLLVILAPAAVFAAGLGAFYVARRLPWLGALAGVALAAGVVGSDAIAAHDVRVAPVDRLEAIEDAFDHAPAQGLVLFPEWEEFAKYFGRRRQVNVGQETFSPRSIGLRAPIPIFARSFDLDEIALPYVEEFPAIVLRRGPDVSRPPANYRMAYRNAFYEVWVREPRGTVADHLPLQLLHRGAAGPRCADVRAFAAAAAPGEALVAARRQPDDLFDYTADPPDGWSPGSVPGVVVPALPADPSGEVVLDEPGTYRVWLRGSTGRPVRISVDGGEVAAASGVNTPQSWLEAGEVRLNAGRHRVQAVRGGGRLAIGDGFEGELGPVALERVGDERLVTVPPADAERALCGRRWDWIERVAR
jgi:hypothetical protein